MNYYVIQVRTRGEEKYLEFARSLMKDEASKLFWPRRSLTIRQQGVVKHSLAPIFPGYVFLEAEELKPEVYWQLKWIPGFFRILRDNRNITPLSGHDRRLLLHFLSFGEIIHKSTVYFDENNRIRVLEGPLKGLEGMIVKVDRRKKRAKVRLNLYDESFQVDFGFEAIERTGEQHVVHGTAE
jgi:transcriptional antiterminator NusG